jgi:dihydroxyacetone kinase DhaKLM complex PTS-EIIA-like component DhaM
LRPPGGLDTPDRAVGTDAVLVLGAIERAWSDDGVVVLMDLGSAVLSAEMAVEMLPDDRREKVLLCEAPFIEAPSPRRSPPSSVRAPGRSRRRHAAAWRRRSPT